MDVLRENIGLLQLPYEDEYYYDEENDLDYLNEIGDTIRGRAMLLKSMKRNIKRMHDFRPSGNFIRDVIGSAAKQPTNTDDTPIRYSGTASKGSLNHLRVNANRAAERITGMPSVYSRGQEYGNLSTKIRSSVKDGDWDHRYNRHNKYNKVIDNAYNHGQNSLSNKYYTYSRMSRAERRRPEFFHVGGKIQLDNPPHWVQGNRDNLFSLNPHFKAKGKAIQGAFKG